MSRMRDINRARGRKAKHSGDVFEQELQARASLIEGALLIKQHPEMKILGNPRVPGNVVINDKGWPDYIWLGHPFVLCFDAKTTTNLNRRKLKPKEIHQLDKLKQMAEIGFPAFFLVVWSKLDVATIHPVLKMDYFDAAIVRTEATVAVMTIEDFWLRALYQKTQNHISEKGHLYFKPMV